MVEPRKLLDDCFVLDGPRLSHAEAIGLLRDRINPVAGTEAQPLAGAAGRTLAQHVLAQFPVPRHNNSAVDGFAFAHASYLARRGSLPISGRSAAGRPMVEPLQSGAAARILTGAVLPVEADTVVMQEDVSASPDGHLLQVPDGLKRGANVRLAGEDVGVGDVLFEPGHVLRAQDLAAIASTGTGEVTCFRRLRVGVVSTGDEIVPPGQPLGVGQVYDANAPMLSALCSSVGANVASLGVLPDDRSVVRDRLQAAALECDVVISSGGASQGDEDHIARVLSELGRRHLWQIAIKPGRPLMFGQIGECVFVGLPGNPVAAFVCFLMYVWPLLRRLGGAPWAEPQRLRLPATAPLGKKPGRREFWRASVVERNGQLAVEKFGRDGSGLITSLRLSDGLIEVDEATETIATGDLVTFIPYEQFGIQRR
jgi:molybdopterin molybdotransferase